jgi:hypothetical protein
MQEKKGGLKCVYMSVFKGRRFRKALDENFGGDFEGKGQNWIRNSVELELYGCPAGFKPLQHPPLLGNQSVDFCKLDTQVGDRHWASALF